MFTDQPQIGFTMPKTTEGIRSLTQINGLSIKEIEKRMKTPDARFSSSGFLGQQESLLEVLAHDNDTVIDLGISHDLIATNIEKLFAVLDYPPVARRTKGMSLSEYSNFMRNLKKKLNDGIEVNLNGIRFLVSYNAYDYTSIHANVESPMEDGFVSSSDNIDVINIDELKKLFNIEIKSSADYNKAYIDQKIPNLNTCKRNFPRILIHLIGSYGFYEGLQSEYRQDPEDIAKFLHIKPLKDSA